MLKRRTSKQNSATPENVFPEAGNMDLEQPEVKNGETDSDENGIPESDKISEPEEITDAEISDSELAALQKELLESQDKYLRLAAEFDNYRKRTLREKMELIQNAGESLLKDILPLVDDFDRGIELASQAEDMDAVRTGMELIYSKLKEFLTNHGVKEIAAMNETFNADLHEAVSKFPASEDDMKGKIMDVIQKGYTLNDKIMRYPKVVVGE